MGMDERSLVVISVAWTCLRMETKWEESFSDASGERRGAQRLGAVSFVCSSYVGDQFLGIVRTIYSS